MYQVKTYNAIAKVGLDTFSTKYQINDQADPDAYLIRSVNLREAKFPDSLKVIARAGAGFNNVPIHQATENGIAVFNTPGSNANAVKELVLSVMIATARNLFAAHDYSQNNIGADVSKRTEHDKTKFNGTELLGKTLIVVGLGHVGSLVANEALNMGMKVIGYDPYLSADAAWNINNRVDRVTDLNQALKLADYVTVHVPKNDETVGLIGKDQLEQMKKTAVLFNYSRIGIVDNKAVVNALHDDKIGFYCTDFGEPVISNEEHVYVTPHIGGSTLEAENNGAVQAANTIMDFLENGTTTNAINLPSVDLPFKAPYRFTIMHQNVPNMVGQITTYIANAGINIDNMTNAAKKKNAYTVIDVDNLVSEQEVMQKIQDIPEVQRIRLIKHN